jgi:hypothetical protein
VQEDYPSLRNKAWNTAPAQALHFL